MIAGTSAKISSTTTMKRPKHLIRNWWVAAIIAGVCGCASPTAPTYDHPNELLLIELTACYAAPLEVGVHFSDKERAVKVDWLCEKDCEMSIMAGWAMIPARVVTYYRPWVHGAGEWALHEVAAHEVCHVLHMSADEAVASQCMARLVYEEEKCQ